jgi:DNA excision repair protein ERCC-6
LTNKVLKDPKQRQTFQMSDLHDLFTLGGENVDGETETGNLFRGSEVKFDDEGNVQAPDATAAEDLAAVKGIDRAEAFKAPESDADSTVKQSEPNDTADSEGGAPTDSRLMSTIFAKTGVHSVLEHDAIVNSTPGGRRRKVQADPAFIQREAKRQAAMAAEQLKKSMEQARLVPAGTPTWTGTFGEAGRPNEPTRPMGATRGGRGGRGGGSAGRGAPSSTSILSNLAARQGRAMPVSPVTSASSTRASTPSAATSTTPTTFRGRRMLEMIRDFMRTHGGTVPTQMLVDHFDHYVRAQPGRSEEFKEMLKVVATLERSGSAQRGRWVLKDEWRAPGAAGA